jgi:replicative DNA helicase
MNQAQDLVLYAIINKGITEFLKAENIPYFEGLQRRVLEACFFCVMRKVKPTQEIIKNYINQDSELKPKHKDAVYRYLNELLSQQRYIDSLSLEKQLEVEYFDRQFLKLSVLKNSDMTLEMKKQLIVEVNDAIHRTKKQDDFTTINKILKEYRESYNDESENKIKSALIRLENEHLKMIFDNTIYPHMYSILARPGDFKTSLLINLMIEFDAINCPGIFYSIEDSASMAAIKAIGAKAGISKKELFQHTYDPKNLDQYLTKFGKNIYVIDKIRTAEETFKDLHNKLSVGNYKWLAIDYLQIIKRDKYMSDYDTINLFDRLLFELNKEFNIPIFRLTQAPKDKVQGNGVLGMGDEKGSGEISQNTRFALSINPPSGNIQDSEICYRIIQRYKTTLSKKTQFSVEFEGATGRILNVVELHS